MESVYDQTRSVQEYIINILAATQWVTSGFGGKWFPLAGLVEVAVFMLPSPS